MSDSRIVVVGSSNTDMVVRSDKLPLPGETVLGGDLVIAPGGKGANQAVAAVRLGAPVTFVAKVGKDMFGRQALENFRREGLDVRFVLEDPAAPSGVALIVVGPGGQNIIAVASGANHRLRPADIGAAREAFTGCAVVLLQLETPIETVLAAAKAGRNVAAVVILNPAPAQPLPEELYRSVDIITPNETEAEILTGKNDPQTAAAVLLERGLKMVIVTLGKDGALVATKGHPPQRIAGFNVHAVDATAAGDAFNGALSVALTRKYFKIILETRDVTDTIRYAHAVAALSVTRLGAQPSLPTADEVKYFLTNIF